MNLPSLYKTVNRLQRRDVQAILAKYSNLIQWRGNDLVMDVGCGTGDVTNDLLKPLLPKNFQRIIGTDISKEMIQFAQKHYENAKVKFEVMDIADDLNEKFRNKFDHVTSFYCLHWIHKKKKVLKNISEMLHSNGDCLLVFVASCPVYDVFNSLSKVPKYQAYMQDAETFIGSLHYSQNPIAEYSELMKSVGFEDCRVDVKQMNYVFDRIEIFKIFLKAVGPFLSRMPIDVQEDFKNDLIEYQIDMDLAEKILDADDYRIIVPYKLLIAYGRK